MCPVLFNIFGVEIRSFGLMLMLGFLVAIFVAKKRAPKFGVTGDKVWEAAFWLIVSGVLGARVLYIAQEWSYFSIHREELFSLKFEGLTSFGSLLFGVPTLAFWCARTKTPFRAMLDIFGIPFLVASAIGRIGCLLNGCCFGRVTEGPFGVHFQGLEGNHFPAQLLDFGMLLLGAWLLSGLEKRGKWRMGVSCGLSLVVFGLSRFIYEFWRAGSIDEVNRGIASSTYWGSLPITEAQAMAGAFIVVGLLMALALRRAPQPLPESTLVP